jgi:hypothetical protein
MATGQADLALRYDLTVPLSARGRAVPEQASRGSLQAATQIHPVCAARPSRRAAAYASSTSATSTRSARRHRLSKRSCARRCRMR